MADYKIVRGELEAYNKLLLEKPEYIFISKKDTVAPSVVVEVVKKLKKLNKNITPISILDPDSLELIKQILNNLILAKTN